MRYFAGDVGGPYRSVISQHAEEEELLLHRRDLVPPVRLQLGGPGVEHYEIGLLTDLDGPDFVGDAQGLSTTERGQEEQLHSIQRVGRKFGNFVSLSHGRQ